MKKALSVCQEGLFVAIFLTSGNTDSRVTIGRYLFVRDNIHPFLKIHKGNLSMLK